MKKLIAGLLIAFSPVVMAENNLEIFDMIESKEDYYFYCENVSDYSKILEENRNSGREFNLLNIALTNGNCGFEQKNHIIFINELHFDGKLSCGVDVEDIKYLCVLSNLFEKYKEN